MNSLARYWRYMCDVRPNLEADTQIHKLNHRVVAALMNAFPKAATQVFARSNGELARLLFADREGGSYRVLRAMYQFEQSDGRGDLINRLLMQSPAVKAARNRRKIAQWMLEDSLNALPANRPTLVLAIGGGDGLLEAEVIARVRRDNIYYCGVDKDPRADADNRDVLNRFHLQDRGCTILGGICRKSDAKAAVAFAEKCFHVKFDGVAVCVCQGIAEYLDMDSNNNEDFGEMLSAVRSCTCPGGRLVISHTDYHDRVKYLEKGLNWYMRLRNRDELADVVEKAGWHISICEHEPMQLITMCQAEKTDQEKKC